MAMPVPALRPARLRLLLLVSAALLGPRGAGAGPIPEFLTSCNQVWQWEGKPVMDLHSYFRRIEVRILYGSSPWRLELLRRAPHERTDAIMRVALPDGDGSAGFLGCSGGKDWIQIGRTGNDARSYKPTHVQLRSPRHCYRGTYAPVELVVLHEFCERSVHGNYHTANLPRDIGAVALVIPLTQSHWSNRSVNQKLSDFVKHGLRGFGPATRPARELDLSAILEEEDLSGAVHVLSGHTEAGTSLAEACAGVLEVVVQVALPVEYLPPKAGQLPNVTAGAAVQLLSASLRNGQLFPPRRYVGGTFPTLRDVVAITFEGTLLLCLLFLSMVAVDEKNQQWEEEHGSGEKEEELSGSEWEVSARSPLGPGSQAAASGGLARWRRCARRATHRVLGTEEALATVNELVSMDRYRNLAILLRGTYLFVVIAVLLLNLSSVNPIVTIIEATCYSHMRWEAHYVVFLIFVFVRLVDLQMYSQMHLGSKEIELWRPLDRSILAKFLLSIIRFSTTWYDLCALLVMRACEWGPWHLTLIIFLSFHLLLSGVLLPLLCIACDKTNKCLYKLSWMDITTTCIGGEEAPTWLWLLAQWTQYGLLNLPMAAIQLIYLLYANGRDALVIQAFFFSVASVVGGIWSSRHLSYWTVEDMKLRLVQRGIRKYLRRVKTHQSENSREKLKRFVTVAGVPEDGMLWEAENLLREPLKPKDFALSALDVVEELKKDGARGATEQFFQTTQVCLRMMQCSHGGLIVIVAPDFVDPEKDLWCESLDDGGFRALLQGHFGQAGVAGGGYATAKFLRIMHLFRRHSDNDRWSEDDLTELRRLLGPQDQGWRRLENQPKDGALILNHRGEVLQAAVRLSRQQNLWDLKKMDGKSFGTRHSGAFATAKYLSGTGKAYLVAVASDSGCVHCLHGGGGVEPPKFYELTEGSPGPGSPGVEPPKFYELTEGSPGPGSPGPSSPQVP